METVRKGFEPLSLFTDSRSQSDRIGRAMLPHQDVLFAVSVPVSTIRLSQLRGSSYCLTLAGRHGATAFKPTTLNG